MPPCGMCYSRPDDVTDAAHDQGGDGSVDYGEQQRLTGNPIPPLIRVQVTAFDPAELLG
jgi:hypothetical protein